MPRIEREIRNIVHNLGLALSVIDCFSVLLTRLLPTVAGAEGGFKHGWLIEDFI